jgi:hypothetical protein
VLTFFSFALAALPTQSGNGFGFVNTCSFIGGTVRVTGGGIVFALEGFAGDLAAVKIEQQLRAWPKRVPADREDRVFRATKC